MLLPLSIHVPTLGVTANPFRETLKQCLEHCESLAFKGSMIPQHSKIETLTYRFEAA